MSEVTSVLQSPIDAGLGGVLLANMVEAWLAGNPDGVTSVEQPMNSKITEQHRSRPAYIYVRQSTNAQVLHHQESTERQYALRTMALELGWSESAIRTLDRDLGMTGTEMTRRISRLWWRMCRWAKWAR